MGIRDWGLGVALVALVVVTACGGRSAALDSCAVPAWWSAARNGGFEGGWGRWTSYWTVEGGPYHTEFGEIFTPEGWVTWWREGFECAGTAEWVTGRPEVKVISGSPDPVRVRSGKQAVQWFTFWRCHEGGLYQRVPAVAGQVYSARAFGHSWYSRCSSRPHDLPFDSDCKTAIDWAHDWLAIGIDPTGGTDPLAATVVWGAEREIYGEYDEVGLQVWDVVAEGEWVTVFVRAVTTHPLKHNDVYWDDVVVWEYHVVYLPVVVR